jgi:hypothetical protein
VPPQHRHAPAQRVPGGLSGSSGLPKIGQIVSLVSHPALEQLQHHLTGVERLGSTAIAESLAAFRQNEEVNL